MEAWHDFFVAQVGATAALVGLLFVALSINIDQILKHSWLPARGGQTLVVLTGSLVLSALALLPDAASRAISTVSFVASTLTWAISLTLVRSFTHGLREQTEVRVSPGWTRGYVASAQAATLPAVIGATALVFGNLDGYYWIAGGVVLTLVFAVYNSWILLVEILR